VSAEQTEVHVELLLGRRVRDENGEVIGRLEECVVERIDGESVVTEFHVGPGALYERIGGFMVQLPLINALRGTPMEYRLAWNLMDLSNPRRPTVRAAKRDLHRVPCDSES
jgi:hypothetical protein